MKKLFSLLLCLLLCLSTLPQLALAEEDVTLSGEGQTGGAGDGATDPDTGPVAPGSPDEKKTDLSSAAVTLDEASFTYDGESKKPSVTVTLGGTQLIADTDYTVAYWGMNSEETEPKKAGEYTVKVTGKDGYTGEASATFTIAPANIGGATIQLENSGIKEENGKIIAFIPYPQSFEPKIVSVISAGKPLGAGDYAFTALPYTKSGEYTLTVTGQGNYTGTASVTLVLTVNYPVQGPEGSSKDLSVKLGDVQSYPSDSSYDDIDKITDALEEKVQEALPDAETVCYEAELQEQKGGNWVPVQEENFPGGGIDVTLPYPDGTNQNSHDFTVAHIPKEGGRLVTSDRIETITPTPQSNGLLCHFSSLSPIAIGYRPKKSGGGGGGSGGGSGQATYYSILVKPPEHGSLQSSRASAPAGAGVTLTVTPDKGYRLKRVTVTGSGGSVPLAGEQGAYAFTMPPCHVTAQAEFEPLWQNPYPDLKGDEWYIEAIEFVSVNGLMQGYGSGNFGAGDPLSRAQMAQILYNREGSPPVRLTRLFSDVPPEAWYAKAVAWAAEKGIVNGVGGGKFAPGQPITREQLATMLWRYAGSPAPQRETLSFEDEAKVSAYARRALCWATEQGIVEGKPGNLLDPKGTATRAQAAQMLKNYWGRQ